MTQSYILSYLLLVERLNRNNKKPSILFLELVYSLFIVIEELHQLCVYAFGTCRDFDSRVLLPFLFLSRRTGKR